MLLCSHGSAISFLTKLGKWVGGCMRSCVRVCVCVYGCVGVYVPVCVCLYIYLHGYSGIRMNHVDLKTHQVVDLKTHKIVCVCVCEREN